MKFKITVTKTYVFYVFAETEEDAQDFVLENEGADWEDHKIEDQTDLHVDVLDMSEDACWLDHNLDKVR